MKYYMSKVIWPPKTQIKYIPNHANGNPDHPDCEIGFVTYDDGKRVFCRFWRKRTLSYEPFQLRTTANSEACNRENLILFRHVRDEVVDVAWEKHCG